MTNLNHILWIGGHIWPSDSFPTYQLVWTFVWKIDINNNIRITNSILLNCPPALLPFSLRCKKEQDPERAVGWNRFVLSWHFQSVITVTYSTARRKSVFGIGLTPNKNASKEWKPLKTTIAAARCYNPIRQMLILKSAKPNPHKNIITLNLGDPTVFGNLATHQLVNQVRGHSQMTSVERAREGVAQILTQ